MIALIFRPLYGESPANVRGAAYFRICADATLREPDILREAKSGSPAPVSHPVLPETEWVLRSRGKLSKAELLGAFSDLMSAVDVSFEDEPAIEEALFTWKNSSAQFADCLIDARDGTLACSATATFDTDVVKLRRPRGGVTGLGEPACH